MPERSEDVSLEFVLLGEANSYAEIPFVEQYRDFAISFDQPPVTNGKIEGPDPDGWFTVQLFKPKDREPTYPRVTELADGSTMIFFETKQEAEAMSVIAETAEEFRKKEAEDQFMAKFEEKFPAVGGVHHVSLCRTCGAASPAGTIDLGEQGCPYCRGY